MARLSRIGTAGVAATAGVWSLAGCETGGETGGGSGPELERALRELVAPAEAEVGIYLEDLADGTVVALGGDVRMHAASTMKVPVMIQLFRDSDAGLGSLEDSVTVSTRFRSIVDGSAYELTSASDSETMLYEMAGQRVEMFDLVERMILRSSNLATNLLIDRADPASVTRTMRMLGADSIEVLRGVEDIPAFEAGLSNTTTARDLGRILSALVRGEAASPRSTEKMLGILLRQEFRDRIPAGVPAGVEVANKVGNITGISHDAAIVFPPGRDPYVLVVLTRGFEDDEAAARVIVSVSALVYRHIVGSSDAE